MAEMKRAPFGALLKPPLDVGSLHFRDFAKANKASLFQPPQNSGVATTIESIWFVAADSKPWEGPLETTEILRLMAHSAGYCGAALCPNWR
jgi:hypothetical protein